MTCLIINRSSLVEPSGRKRSIGGIIPDIANRSDAQEGEMTSFIYKRAIHRNVQNTRQGQNHDNTNQIHGKSRRVFHKAGFFC